jgi:PAS domain S-box-containing protein
MSMSDEVMEHEQTVVITSPVLEELNQRVVLILENMSDAFFALDNEWRLVYMNQVAERVFGEKRENFLGKNIWDIFPGSVDSEFYRQCHRAMAEGITVEFEAFGPLLQKWLEVRAHPSKKGLSVFFRDVTSQRTTDMMRYYMEALIEASNDAIIAKTLDGHVVCWNKGAEQLYGYTAEEMLGNTTDILTPPELMHEVEDIILNVSRGENINSYETLRVRKDGTLINVSLTASPIRDAQGIVLGVSVIGHDITERKRVEEALRQSERKFRLLVESIPQMVWTTGPDGILHYCNQRWLDYTGLSSEQLQAEDAPTVLHPDDELRFQELWQTVLATGASYEIEYRMRCGQDGSYHWFLVRGIPVRDYRGDIVEWIGTCTEIDDQKRIEEELREKERRKDDFIGIASHELKTPITTIKAMNQLLQRRLERENNQQAVGYLARMDGQINRLTRLISDLLDVTKIQAGRLELVRESFDFDEWLKGIIDDLQQGNSHKITCSGNVGRAIVGDRDRLGQVVTNLVTNGIKYSPCAKTLDVRVTTDQDSVVVSVQDYGIGIPTDLQERIFERFFRVMSDRNVSGLGMGLYITSEIVKLHGGKIWVESVEGKGSTFSFSLPLA